MRPRQFVNRFGEAIYLPPAAAFIAAALKHGFRLRRK